MSYATPLVRRLAAENNVDLAEVRGTGVAGRITAQDVRDAAAGAEFAHLYPPVALSEPTDTGDFTLAEYRALYGPHAG